jgi:hypothetical protein
MLTYIYIYRMQARLHSKSHYIYMQKGYVLLFVQHTA